MRGDIAETQRLLRRLTLYVDVKEILEHLISVEQSPTTVLAEDSWENEGGGLLRGPLMCELPSTIVPARPLKAFKRPFATQCDIVDAIKNDYVSKRRIYPHKSLPYDGLVPTMLGKF